MDKWGVAQWFISSKFFSEIMFFCSTILLLTVSSMSFAEKQRQSYSQDMKSNLMSLGYLATSNQQIWVCQTKDEKFICMLVKWIIDVHSTGNYIWSIAIIKNSNIKIWISYT